MIKRPRRKAEETREDILSMAEMLFRERGYLAVSIADIAGALHMSPANVFKHFHSKVALIDAIAGRHLDNATERFAAFEQDLPPKEQLLRFVLRLLEGHLQDIQKNPYIFEMVLSTIEAKLDAGNRYRARIEQKLGEIIREGIVEGRYQCRDPESAARTVADVLACVLHPILIARDDKETLVHRAEDIVGFVDAALQNNAC
ncbi:TetR/AcrR family transcriptional repressor of the ameABC operon [Rhizobium leguminosarum]|uniref:TetR/AcrR family transcriptional repressor of the ameABC operon n=1 Tax=Rhizobium leguminosarum TaxID=384 RepID=A0AAE2SYH7_RHILE|nr:MULTISPECIES: TetR family transcriptional regulator [Rhizobium]MBB4293021.1 TetR/AcrR family transcriptional repressor of the ameABC operon [Rhizobium leguminosarum]MBB4298943.1 TetR/AcrR family transcriptional repressor of the ameABC operon [Rhizobium leguminosarum]MBB4310442.1 TetR/AcrR family transcriptional repressor of the ameABC operon [Rhizobium leguminosarum]MBB4419558.1 TetR/AcrR family transcriptional repressor of the ameABC operon [Rhizobium leguminosarum]MBB4434704.1 TetR/AcrR f